MYEKSDLSKVTLEFTMEMDEVYMENFFAVTRSIEFFDQSISCTPWSGTLSVRSAEAPAEGSLLRG